MCIDLRGNYFTRVTFSQAHFSYVHDSLLSLNYLSLLYIYFFAAISGHEPTKY